MSESKISKRILFIIGAVLCCIFAVILVCNLTIIIKGVANPRIPPSVFGVTPMVVQSGSMSGNAEDHIEVGDLIFTVKPDTDKLKAGDIISFMDGNIAVTHRIIEVQAGADGKRSFITKGDANNTEDLAVGEDAVFGLYKGRVPGLGDFAMFLQKPLGMAVFLLLTTLFPIWVSAEGAPAPTEVPMESVSPYRIILTAPGGWTSGNGAVMKVSITDKDRLGWQKIEYRMNGGNWVDCENLFADGRAELTLHENGTFTLRVTDPHGHAFEESADVKCIDLTAPVLTASINGTTLQVDAKDDLSGVAGVQVNSMLFTTLVNGTLNVELDANMNQFEKLAVRAFDYAGNFSEPVTQNTKRFVR